MKYINKKNFIEKISIPIITLILLAFSIWLLIDFCIYPEIYLTTWKYNLKQKIDAGDEEAIQYYNEVYLQKNKKLWN